jgi:uncharacterized protein (TIGR03435 family)
LAYQVHDFEVTGGPAWIDSDLYDIDAKAESPPTPSPQFANLFNLAIHRETRELPVYELTVAKDGLKVQPATCIQRVTGDTNIAPDKKQSDYCGPAGVGRGRIEASGAAMAFLADLLSRQLSRRVVDKTGIPGTFKSTSHMPRMHWPPRLAHLGLVPPMPTQRLFPAPTSLQPCRSNSG